MKRIFIFITLLIILFPAVCFTFNIDRGEIEFYINNISRINYYEHLKIDFNIHPFEKIKINFSIANRLKNFTSVTDIQVLVWKIGINYQPKYNMSIGIGDKYLNYSQYILHSEKWNDNSFKGLFFHYFNNRYEIKLDGFLGLHAQDTNRIKFNGEYLKTDIGFINKYYINKIQTETPSIWGVFKITKKIGDYLNNEFIYLSESYTLEKAFTGFSSYYFFYNNIFQNSIFLKYRKKLCLGFIPILMMKNYEKYNGAGDYYGEGKHKLVFDYKETENIFSGEVSICFNNLVDAPVLNSALSIKYRYMETGFNPAFMDNGRIKEDRCENFLNDILQEEKGFIINIEIPVIINTYWGINYQSFRNTVNDRMYTEKRYFLRHNITSSSYFSVMYYFKNGYLSEYGNIDNMNGLIFGIDGNITEYLKLGISYAENKWYTEGNNVFVFKTYIIF